MAAGESRVLGVSGAGTMGAGIAQIACMGGFETRLHDPFPASLERGIAAVAAGLEKGAARGRWSAEEAAAARERLSAVETLEGLAGCDVVIEAAPEDLELKRELFGRLSEVCGPDAVLATNTSSLPVTALASAAARPQQVVGMHFFNPVVLMDLLEVVAGSESSEQALATAQDAGRRMGKRVIVAQDGPGFLANRCARPFGMEALKLLGEGVAAHDQIDRIVRMGGGFRMGPFELMDLVGIDVGFEVSKSFWEQSFHEPRWRPSTIQARMVQAGRLGRKSGRGYYDYSGDSHRPEDPAGPAAGGEGTLAIEGDSGVAADLRVLAEDAGYDVRMLSEFEPDNPPDVLIDAAVGRSPLEPVPEAEDAGTLVLVLCVDGSLSELDVHGGAVGFYALPPLEDAGVIELTRSGETSDTHARRAERLVASFGKHAVWSGDAPGLVLGRIVSQLVNEACFAVAEGVGSAADVDLAMRHGYNYPRGPLEWGDVIELDHVLAILDALREELGEERYRAAPLLRRLVAEGRLGESTGEGFFTYD
jgi:3-hydroxybutyryl-CoA dehydrogenase